MMNDWHGAGMGGMWLLYLIFWLAVIVTAIMVVRGVRRQNSSKPPAPDALEILKRRYARGEIDQAAYRRMKEELEKR